MKKLCNCEDNSRGGKNSVKTECARQALEYIQTQLKFNPALNACEVYQYLQANYSCDLAPGTIEGPTIPGTLPDNWTDNGGNAGEPEEEYDESKRKPIWWYHTDHLGSSTYLTDNFGRPSHYYDNLPFGETMVEHNQSRYYGNQYKFNGKELDSTTGMYYYGARYYEPRFSIFVSVDPLAEQTMTPYQYVNNNPINFIDPDGLFPRPLLIYNKEKGSYKFTKSAVHLLHLVSGVSKPMIENVQVLKRGPGKYVPFYSSNSGGGAITLGNNGNNGKIIYTQNFFEDDKSKYNGHGYGQDIKTWLGLSAHEVGHLPQIDKHDGVMSYLGEFVNQYSQNGHDNAPYEIDAERGYETFDSFNSFIDKAYGKNTLIKLFEATEENNGRKGTETYKIETIDKYWKEYQKSRSNENK